MTAVIHSTKKYEELSKRFQLRPIHDEKEYDEASEVLDELVDRVKSLDHDEQDYLEVLSDLISKYEEKDDDKGSVDLSPVELIKYLMDENDLSQKDLIPEFGSASRVSEFISGTRPLSLEQAKKLANRFSLKISALLS